MLKKKVIFEQYATLGHIRVRIFYGKNWVGRKSREPWCYIHPPKCAVYIILFHEEFGVCTCWAQIYKYFVFILKYINGNKIFPFSHLGHGELKIFACVLLWMGTLASCFFECKTENGCSISSIAEHFYGLVNRWQKNFITRLSYVCCGKSDDKDIQQTQYLCGCHANA